MIRVASALEATRRLLAPSRTRIVLLVLLVPLPVAVLRVMPLRVPWIDQIAISQDGRYLAASLSGHQGAVRVRVWDIASRREVGWLYEQLGSLRFTADGRLAGVVDGEVGIWDPSTGRRVWSLRPYESVRTKFDFSPDGCTLATIAPDQPLKIWDIATLRERRSFEVDLFAESVRFLPDGQTIAVGRGKSWSVTFWDPNTATRRSTGRAAFRSSREPFEITPDGKTLVAILIDDNREVPIGIQTWDIESAKPLTTIKGRHTHIALSGDGARLATEHYPDRAIRVWDVGTGRPICVIHLPSDPRLTTRRLPGTAWDPTQMRLAFEPPSSVMCLQFCPDRPLLFAAFSDGSIKAWNVATTDLVFSLVCPLRNRRIGLLAACLVWGIAWAASGVAVRSAKRATIDCGLVVFILLLPLVCRIRNAGAEGDQSPATRQLAFAVNGGLTSLTAACVVMGQWRWPLRLATLAVAAVMAAGTYLSREYDSEHNWAPLVTGLLLPFTILLWTGLRLLGWSLGAPEALAAANHVGELTRRRGARLTDLMTLVAALAMLFAVAKPVIESIRRVRPILPPGSVPAACALGAFFSVMCVAVWWTVLADKPWWHRLMALAFAVGTIVGAGAVLQWIGVVLIPARLAAVLLAVFMVLIAGIAAVFRVHGYRMRMHRGMLAAR